MWALTLGHCIGRDEWDGRREGVINTVENCLE